MDLRISGGEIEIYHSASAFSSVTPLPRRPAVFQSRNIASAPEVSVIEHSTAEARREDERKGCNHRGRTISPKYELLKHHRAIGIRRYLYVDISFGCNDSYFLPSLIRPLLFIVLHLFLIIPFERLPFIRIPCF